MKSKSSPEHRVIAGCVKTTNHLVAITVDSVIGEFCRILFFVDAFSDIAIADVY